jgi:ribosomal protein S18 acetylase RimI-like enzyme
MPKLKLHKAGKKDRDTVARFVAELWGRLDEGPAALKEAAARVALLDGADYDALLFEQGGKPVAYALVRDNGDHVFIRHFIVAAAERRRGLGRACLALLLDEFGHPEARVHLRDDEAGAAAFFRAQGFAPAAVLFRRPAAALSADGAATHGDGS